MEIFNSVSTCKKILYKNVGKTVCDVKVKIFKATSNNITLEKLENKFAHHRQKSCALLITFSKKFNRFRVECKTLKLIENLVFYFFRYIFENYLPYGFVRTRFLVSSWLPNIFSMNIIFHTLVRSRKVVFSHRHYYN